MHYLVVRLLSFAAVSLVWWLLAQFGYDVSWSAFVSGCFLYWVLDGIRHYRKRKATKFI